MATCWENNQPVWPVPQGEKQSTCESGSWSMQVGENNLTVKGGKSTCAHGHGQKKNKTTISARWGKRTINLCGLLGSQKQHHNQALWRKQKNKQ